MRLLRREEGGEFCLAEYAGKNIPQYAILSHTWGADQDEVIFKDIIEGSDQNKSGYRKLDFCARQAQKDGLEFFWIDTCCIDKSSSAELSESINSMFQWYQKAEKCYVFLSDLSVVDSDEGEVPSQQTWIEDFQNSKWFTRGWTLQELLAPDYVEFFSAEGKSLGNRTSLLQEIHSITGISTEALQGCPLSQFSVEDRMTWANKRDTKREEDAAYSLLGIFDTHMPLIYGEGREKAFARLQREIDPSIQFQKENKACMHDLRLTDPRDDKKRIEETKGGLLEDSCRWILEHSDFKRWRDQQSTDSQLLWIKGDPGKGKTMLICGIVNELRYSMAKTALMSYFFCQATDSRINNATAVLRGLIYMLANQKPSLMSHLREKYDQAGKSLFEDANAWVALSQVLTNMIQDKSMDTTYLIVDALDECTVDLQKLLELIVENSLASPRVKWIISSRNWPDIEEKLEAAGHKVRLCLELNAKSVSTAVSIFIRHKVQQLAASKKYDSKTRDAVLKYLLENAHDTFLWVALVCQNLEKISRWNVLAKLKVFPPGLVPFYNRMMQNISNSDDSELCKQILAVVAIVYRPITLQELTSLIESIEDLVEDVDSLREIIGLCGSFLTVRENTIYFVHQSAKDFLLTDAAGEVFLSGIAAVHRIIFRRAIHVLSKTLRRDMYDLGRLDCHIDQVIQPQPDPFAASRYSCLFWAHHIYDWGASKKGVGLEDDLEDGSSVHDFLRTRYLFWLEALSLNRGVSEGLMSMRALELTTRAVPTSTELMALVRDAQRFTMYYKVAIENYPLQTYYSALFFSPSLSLIRDLNHDKILGWATICPNVEEEWGACVQTLEGHKNAVHAVAFSTDSTLIASGSSDETARIWNAFSGKCLHALVGHEDSIHSVCFSHDAASLSTGSGDSTVKVWDVDSGRCLITLEGHAGRVTSIRYSHDSTWLASAADGDIRIWDPKSGKCLQKLDMAAHGGWPVLAIAISHDSKLLAAAGTENEIQIWDTRRVGMVPPPKGLPLGDSKDFTARIYSLDFSHDSKWLASGTKDETVRILDLETGDVLHLLRGHKDWVLSVAFSYDSKRLVSASYDTTIKIWDTSNGACIRTFEGHGGSVHAAVFSKFHHQIASVSKDATIKIWDARSRESSNAIERHSRAVSQLLLSHDGKIIASASEDTTIKLWNARNANWLKTLTGHKKSIQIIVFSHDSKLLASASKEWIIKLWDVSSGTCLHTFSKHIEKVYSITFSHDSSLLASGSSDMTANIWRTSSGECLLTLSQHDEWVTSVNFSHDSKWIATTTYDGLIKIWDVETGECLQMLDGHDDFAKTAVFSQDSKLLASAGFDKMVKLWSMINGECLHTFIGHAADALAFLRRGEWLVATCRDNAIRIWDTSSGQCVKILTVEGGLSVITPDSHGNLQTLQGVTIIIDPDWKTPTVPIELEPEPAKYQGWGLTVDGSWITYYSEKVLWLPSDYRGGHAARSDNSVVIGTASGKVWIFKFDMSSIPPYLLEKGELDSGSQ